jgi:hypothetical protein
MRQGFIPAGHSIMNVELLIGSNTKPKAHREIADVILMCETMKTTDFQIAMDNTNSKKPDRSMKILRYSFPAREWE